MVLAALISGVAATLLVLALERLFGPGGFFERKQQLNERMSSLGHSGDKTFQDLLKTANYSDVPAVKGFLRDHSFSEKVADLLSVAGLKISVSIFFLSCLILGIVTFLFLQSKMNFVFAAPLSLAFVALPYLYLEIRRLMYLKQFSENFADAIAIIAGSIRVGHGLEAAFDVVARSAAYPVSTEFRKIRSEMELGMSLQGSLRNLYDRIRTPEVKIFVTGVVVHQEIGGNLSELLDNLEKTIRDRFAILREIKTLSAQGKLTAWILFFGPLAMAVFWFMSDRAIFIDYLNSNLGHSFITLAIVCQLIGFIWIRFIVQLKD